MDRPKSKRKKQNTRMRKAASRIALLAFFFTLLSATMVGRVLYFKIVKGAEFEKKVTLRTAEAQYELQPLRGNIIDRNGNNLVVSVIAYDVILDPSVLLEHPQTEQIRTLETLAEELQISQEELRAIVEKYPDSKYKVIQKEISQEIEASLRSKKLQGVWLQETFVRKYPKESLMAQTIGFFNKTGQGQYGIEQEYNDLMIGLTGRVFPQLQEGNIVTSESVPAVNGYTLGLTLDENIQQFLEEALQAAAKEFRTVNASAIAINPNTGEILAIAGYPTYNPNQYNNLSEQLGKDIWDEFNKDEKGEALNKVWKNYNIHTTYEPGSTFKPIFIAAALEEGVISLEETFYCSGSKVVADKTIGCAKKSGHGHINLEEALAFSCNVAMMDIAEKLGPEKFIQYQKSFGLGEVTGLDLPGEEVGILHKLEQMGPVELATASFGQTFNMTPLQLISAYAATINGGNLMRPYILSQVIDENGEIIKENKPFLRRKVISKEVSDIIRLQSESVIIKGTGGSAAIAGYRVGGKTGTAEKLPREEEKYIHSFIGYAPVENPQVMILTLFDEPEVEVSGTGLAGRVFKEIMERTLPYLGIQPLESMEEDLEETVVIPDFTGQNIYQVSETLEYKDLQYEAIGIGIEIKNQYPTAGAVLPRGSTIKLYFSSDEPENCVVVPDFRGLTLEEIQETPPNHGLIIEIEGEAGNVIEQVPKPDMKIEKDSAVILWLRE